MSPLQIIEEWRRGCSCATPGKPEECPECTKGAIEAIERQLVQQQAIFRALRLVHWDALKLCRANGLNHSANAHVVYIQALNDFFPVGDTAEKDASARAF